jgi:spore maturation protein CgeB
MELAIFGLTVSSSWGNGHATLWRGLIHALAKLGHRVTFFERDVPYYAQHRDCFGLPNGELILYSSWDDVRAQAEARVARADIAIVTSYCPHGREASALVLESRAPCKVFYDLDSPITLASIERGESVPYLPEHGLADFDLVLSYAGGQALRGLAQVLGARRVVPLYGGVDPLLHRPQPADARYAAALSYLGTYAPDRQSALEALFLEPAALHPELRFALGGSQYPQDFPWRENVYYHQHVPPFEHASYFCSARLNLNITRAAMAQCGYCPSGRLFEAAACGACLISDIWPGIESFYTPGSELLLANNAQDVVNALALSDAELRAIAERARERTLDEHTQAHRARTLIRACEARATQSAQSAMEA